MDIKWIAIPGAIASALGIWGALGFPTIATGGQIDTLTRAQAETAVEVYENKSSRLLRDEPLYTTDQQRAIWRKSYDKALRQLRDAEQRKIRAPK